MTKKKQIDYFDESVDDKAQSLSSKPQEMNTQTASSHLRIQRCNSGYHENLNISHNMKPHPPNSHGLRKMSLKPHTSQADESFAVSAGEGIEQIRLREKLKKKQE